MRSKLVIIGYIILAACGSDNTENTSNNTTENVPVIAQSFSTDDTLYIVASGETMAEINFDKKVIRVPADKDITIALTNESTDASMPHNIVIIKEGAANEVGQSGVKFKDNAYVNPNDENVIAHSDLARIGETVYFSFKTPLAGNYEFICSFPGHWGLMKGSFVTK